MTTVDASHPNNNNLRACMPADAFEQLSFAATAGGLNSNDHFEVVVCNSFKALSAEFAGSRFADASIWCLHLI